MWEATGGKTHAERERKVCHGCDLFGTKTDAGKKTHKFYQTLVADAFRIRALRLTGYPANTAQMSPSQFEVAVLIEEMIEDNKRGLAVETLERLTALVAR